MPTLAELTLLSTLVRRLEARLGAERAAQTALTTTDLAARVVARRAALAALVDARRGLAFLPPRAAGTPAARRRLGQDLRALQAELAALQAERAQALKSLQTLVADDRAATPAGTVPFRSARRG